MSKTILSVKTKKKVSNYYIHIYTFEILYTWGHLHSTYALKCRKLDLLPPPVRTHTFLLPPSPLAYVLFVCTTFIIQNFPK